MILQESRFQKPPDKANNINKSRGFGNISIFHNSVHILHYLPNLFEVNRLNAGAHPQRRGGGGGLGGHPPFFFWGGGGERGNKRSACAHKCNAF